MKNIRETTISQTIIHKGKFLEFHQDTVKLPNGKQTSREFLHHPGAIAAIPILNDGRIVMVKQFRYPTGQILLEIPAGKLDAGEDPLDCVRRELSEEIGYEPRTITYLTSIWTTPGFTDEVIHLYLAKDLQPLFRKPDDDEFLQVAIFTKAELLELLMTEPVVDGKTALALLYAEQFKSW